ncbi:MAG: DEAD/DEAH box helicase [Planctomycetota bacterium]|nr:DEAD/DEAH box helicase [Planctomycetota bacterium]
MNALEVLSQDFYPTVQSGGENYHQRNRVRITDAFDGVIKASVRGTRMYQVSIELTPETTVYDCSCPYFQANQDPCKHIWATLLTAESQGKLPHDVIEVGAFSQDENSEQDGSEAPQSEEEGDGHGDTRLAPSKPQSAEQTRAPAPARHAIWRRRLTEIRSEFVFAPREEPSPWPANREIAYVIDVANSMENQEICLELCSRTKARPGTLADRWKKLRLEYRQISHLADPTDRQLMWMLGGASAEDDFGFEAIEVPYRVRLRDSGNSEILRLMCQTGRCRMRLQESDTEWPVLTWDDGPPWELHLVVIANAAEQTFRLAGSLRRGERTVDINEPTLILPGGPVFIGNTLAALEDFGAWMFVALLRSEREINVPFEQADEFLAELLRFPRLPRLDLPPELQTSEVRLPPRPRLKVSADNKKKRNGDSVLHCRVSFEYNSLTIPLGDASPAILDAGKRQIIHRDFVSERQAISRLGELGFKQVVDYRGASAEFRLAPKSLPAAVRALIEDHWQVEVDGKVHRTPGKVRLEVSSGIDWFEVRGDAEFDGVRISLPRLLGAVRKGETSVVLDDGTVGILPEEWLKKYGLLAAVGEAGDESVQFARNQAGLLDALLAGMPEVNVDETFATARNQLRRFDGIEAIDPPVTFVGELRPYQREGLGWMRFLRLFGLQGCLADDMGLGKTVQVLALLEERRLQRAIAGKDAVPAAGAEPFSVGPSLVVVPRSLVFNWQQEATRFAPALRVLDHATGDRLKTVDHFRDFDVVLTTYGTLRNDIALLRDLTFDYVILDEAQAIKNPASESAKAARLLQSTHRMALSGTPVQNHLGELWSLFEFLNPGMLGASRAFSAVAAGRAVEPETRTLLSSALRPLILRRTKEQVARDLPEKFEQTIFCELEKAQRSLYDELKEHYRQALMQRIETDGLAKSKIQILEALLRLRQAACHPGLLDKTRIGEPSAKLDTLIPRLTEVVQENHKAIVFSQFTSLLAIVRKKLDDDGVIYEYLDGKTRDRQARVDRFQTDPQCKLFLVSLKAGGLGLNLTAAQYVFLLDPWWNPAIEAQAIDRAHRIGQTQQVFAYRLIARDTVEEKVLQLQQSKRELADAIINADNALISNLGREDLELLLS